MLIALGGGPRHGVARRLALAIREARPELRIRVAGGFGRTDARDADGITWLGPQRGLASELASCGVAITGGGVSLYEAVTLRTPVVAWPVVQRPDSDGRGFRPQGARRCGHAWDHDVSNER